MEENYKVQITTKNHFAVEKSEFKHLYITLALLNYAYLRHPEYNEKILLEYLEKDFKKFFTECQNLFEKEPNNLILNKILTFFNFHYKEIRDVRNSLD